YSPDIACSGKARAARGQARAPPHSGQNLLGRSSRAWQWRHTSAPAPAALPLLAFAPLGGGLPGADGAGSAAFVAAPMVCAIACPIATPAPRPTPAPAAPPPC